MPTRGYGSHVPNPGPLAAGGHVMADSVRVTIIPTLTRSTSNLFSPGSTWPRVSTAARDRRGSSHDLEGSGSRPTPLAGTTVREALFECVSS